MVTGEQVKVERFGMPKRGLWPPLALAAGCAIAGCSSGTVDIVDLNYKRINQTAPLINHLPVRDAWWWVEDNRLYVALKDEGGGLFGKLSEHSLELSFEFQGLPASTARDYQVDRATMRAYTRSGATHGRFASEKGIAGLWFESGGILRGRYRMVARQQTFNVLTGWSRASNVVFVGEFRATENETKGHSILKRTEDEGMERYTPRGERRSGKPVKVEGPPVNQPKN